MNKNYYAIIMAGGIGSRFWPISRTSHPKQFIDILGTGKTLIQNTYDRFLKICPKENIYVVTNEIYTGLVKQQLPDMGDHQILDEPAFINTIEKSLQAAAEHNCLITLGIKPSRPDTGYGYIQYTDQS